MTYPRSHLIDFETPQYCHLVSRCVRRAWLCGVDGFDGTLIRASPGVGGSGRAIGLSEVFAVELYGYAVMSNHYHLVMRVDPKGPEGWSDEMVARRWGGYR